MADQDARALLLTIQANTELLRSNLSAAERSIEDFTNKTQAHLDESDKRFEIFGKSIESLEGPLERLKSLGEFALGAALGESLIETGKHALEFAGNVKFVSEQVGTSTDFLQKYRFAAGQFGVGTQEADAGLTKFARSVGEAANGNKAIIELFNRLGVNVRDAGGNVRSVESVFLDTANAIQKIKDPAQQSADTLTLMGRGAAGLKPLLAEGAAGFSELAAQAQALGVVLGPELIEHSEEVNHKLAALKGIVDAQMASAIAQNAGAIEGLASAFVKAAGAVATFMSGHPERALGILGFVTGLKVGGPAAPEAALALGAAGYAYGSHLKQTDDNGNTDLDFRKDQLDQANAKVKADRRLRSQSGGSLVDSTDYRNDLAALQLQLDLMAKARSAPRTSEAGLGSNGAGFTNDNGDDLKNAQAQLGHLQELQAHASGDALKGINEEIVQQKRKIAFIKQGADAELASSLASKQGAAQRKDASDAKTAAHKAEEQRQKDLSDDITYSGDVRKLREQILTGMRKTATNDAATDALQIEGINADADAAKKQNQLKLDKGDFGSDPKVARARLDNLNGTTTTVGLVDQNRNQQLANVGIERLSQQNAQKYALSEQDLQNQENVLSIQDQLATTSAKRRDIELQLLDLQQKQALAAQQKILDDGKASDDAKALALQQKNALLAIAPLQRQQVIQNTQGPGQQYTRDLNSKGINDQLDSVKVDGLGSLESGLTGVIDGTKTVKAAFHDMATSIIDDLVKIAVEQEIIKPLANALFPGSGGSAAGGGGLGGIGGLFGSIGKLFGGGGATSFSGIDAQANSSIASIIAANPIPALSIPGLAGGGSFVVGGNSGIDKNIMSINGEPTVRIGSGETVAVIPPRIPSARSIGQDRQQAAQVSIHVAANDYFDAKVASISGGQINSAAPHIAAGGAQLAGNNAARARRRSLA